WRGAGGKPESTGLTRRPGAGVATGRKACGADCPARTAARPRTGSAADHRLPARTAAHFNLTSRNETIASPGAAAEAGCMTATASLERQATYREVLAEPRFRLLFLTRSLAIGADTLRTVALSMLIFAATGSPLLAAVTYGIAFLPQAIGGTLLGALADRARPRPLIAMGYCLEAGTAVALALARLPSGARLALVAHIAP